LERNLSRNRAANVRTVASAVGAEEGSVPFFRGENDAESSTVQRRGLAPDGEVPTAPLPHLLTPEEAARVALVKIDVEGGEADVLRGMVRDAAWMPARLRIVVEVHVHHLVRAGVAPADLVTPFSALGFAATWLPVAFDEASHLHPPTNATPRQPPFPGGDLFHLILARG
jgi:FkbM family methyltransferase